MLGALIGTGISLGVKAGSDWLKGTTSNYFAEKRARDQAALEYEYAERYAKNSPSWNVQGLRDAGLNPILAASNGVHTSSWSPSSPSIPDTNSQFSMEDALKSKQAKLLDAQIQGQIIKNENDSKNLGLTGRDATIVRLANELGLTPEKVRDFLGFDFGNSTSPHDNSKNITIPDLLQLTDKSRKDFNATLFGYPKRIPLLRTDKPADISRMEEANSGTESYVQWLNHPSNQRYRGNTYRENEYLFERDVRSGHWRKKGDGKFGYK